ncbi:C40 family peptidase [Alkaliphilus oremlandii]|nr:SH3 domain-containing protein [Alkaliphilus oremlandii]
MKRRRFVMCMALASSIFTTTFASGLDYSGTIISTQAIIREDKFGNSKELDKLNIGSKVMIKEILDEWYLVELSNGKGEGWISSQEAIITDANYRENKIKKGEITGDGLRVRVGPSLNDNVITNVSSGHIVTIIGESAEWYEVILSNNVKGWVHSDYVKITHNLPTGRLVNDAIALKEYAGENEKNVDTLKISEMVYIKGYQDKWYNVITSSNKEGWVESKYVSVQNTNVNRSSSGRNAFEDIEAIATKYLGKKYVSGGNGPNGFDCSGFTSYILKTYYSDYLNAKGIKQLPRTATGQAGIGTTVNRGELEIGDLVFFDTSGKIGNDIGHVGIYIGNGRIIHASTSRRQIVIDSLSDRYYSTRYMKAIRL